MNRKISNFLKIFFIVFLLGSGTACHQGLKSDLPVVQLKIKGHEILAEVANKPATRMSGLMFRRELGTDTGMLFVFPDVAPRAFWMKNTLIPLSVAFIDEKGVIENILEMPPETLEGFPSKGPAKFVLEMNAGWFGKNELKPGDVVEGAVQAPPAND